MKTMTCRRLGGACDLALQGESADEIIQQQDRHLKDAVAAGDATHEQANDDMRGRWKRPKKSLDWYLGVKRDFAALPED
jgi:predicted small metal-binding protein